MIKQTFLLTLAAMLVFVSCTKDEEAKPEDKTPEYIGKWVNEEIDPDLGVVSSKITLELKETTWENHVEKAQTTQDITTWSTFIKMSGGLNVENSTATFVLRSFSFPNNEGNLTIYSDTDDNFTDKVEQFNLNKTTLNNISVSGNELTLKTDSNQDGEFSEDEITKYTKI